MWRDGHGVILTKGNSAMVSRQAMEGDSDFGKIRKSVLYLYLELF